MEKSCKNCKHKYNWEDQVPCHGCDKTGTFSEWEDDGTFKKAQNFRDDPVFGTTPSRNQELVNFIKKIMHSGLMTTEEIKEAEELIK